MRLWVWLLLFATLFIGLKIAEVALRGVAESMPRIEYDSTWDEF